MYASDVQARCLFYRFASSFATLWVDATSSDVFVAPPRGEIVACMNSFFEGVRISGMLNISRPLAGTVLLAACGIVEPGSTYSIPRAVTEPVPAGGTQRFTSITSGFFHSCGIDAEGRVWCWGDNQYRQSGLADAGEVCDQTSTCALRPVRLQTGLRFRAVSAGTTHSCALTRDGAAYCWGGGYDSGRGMLGNGKLSQSATPLAIAEDLRFKSISAGGRITCAISTDDQGYCWGLGGFTGDGRATDALTPSRVAGEHRFKALQAGVLHACGITTDGAAYCWGSNQNGELGNGSIGDRDLGSLAKESSPVPVRSDRRFQSITTGGNHSCGITLDGEAFCWGQNHVGQLGTGAASFPHTSPQLVTGGNLFKAVAAGTVHTCALQRDGTARCWGGNWFGGIGDGTSSAANTGKERPLATPVSGTRTFVQVAPGGSHTCALDGDGRVWCWGDRGRGQMGNGTS